MLVLTWYFQNFKVDDKKSQVEDTRRLLYNYWKYQSDLRTDAVVIETAELHKNSYKDTSIYNSKIFDMVWNQTADKVNAIYGLKILKNETRDSSDFFYSLYSKELLILFDLKKKGHSWANDSTLHIMAEEKETEFRHIDFDAQAIAVKQIAALDGESNFIKSIATILFVIATILISYHQAIKFYQNFKAQKEG
ncbi:hypothetical protein ACQ86N_42265 [Puia sp. P3]|uniref:hypothetical protein n=1 Tax=Puia sp. P3 TaxID=3423952 RepID=UPI003D67659A